MTLTTVIPTDPPWGSLLESARNGDEDAFEQLWHRTRPMLNKLCSEGLGRDLRSKLGASDVVQVTMLDIFRNLKHFTGDSEQAFVSWVVRLAKNNLIDEARRYRLASSRQVSREQSIERKPWQASAQRSGLTASSIVERREEDTQLAAAIGKLPTKQRLVVEMRHRGNLSYAEISEELGVTEPAARKLWSRAIHKLQQALTPHDGKPTRSERGLC